jgi:endo-1,4-beta-D-glucanase Y
MMDAVAFNRRQALEGLGASFLTAAWAASASAQSSQPKQATPPADCSHAWPAWAVFRQQFVAEDGRVLDPETQRAQTVSEAQAYGLFFALVANDRPSFEKILKWTENNMAGGDLTARLPAWIWGRRDDGQWGVVDPNPASDADLWIIYALAEGGRLWGDKRLGALATVMADRLLRDTTANIPGLGLTLLPGPKGFQSGGDTWRLNPSYLPLHQMRWFAKHMPNPAWEKVLASARKLVLGSAPRGFSPDWIVYRANKGFEIDVTGEGYGQGAYNAIRVYLWAGLMASGDPNAKALLNALAPMAKFVAVQGFPPEAVDIQTGAGTKPGPSGFSAALLPFLQARGDKTSYDAQINRLAAKPIRPKAYYEHALSLFAFGKIDGFYRFSADGSLVTKWTVPCQKLA